MALRLVFMGTPEFAVPVLTEIVGHGHEIAAVYTRPPAPAGRGMALRRSPVHEVAEGFGIPVRTPKSLRRREEQEAFAALAPDVAVVVAYGLILPAPVLAVPPLGCLNLHASLLPRWRGAAPIQRAIMAGDRETGVMVMKMEEGLDTGPVAMTERLAIRPEMNARDLHDALMRLGADLMARALAALERGSLGFVPQAETGVTYAAKIGSEDSRLDLARPAAALHDQIRGLSPHPCAFLETGGKRLKVLAARPAEGGGPPGTLLDAEGTLACGTGALRLITVQPAGKGPMEAEAFLRGARLKPGDRLA